MDSARLIPWDRHNMLMRLEWQEYTDEDPNPVVYNEEVTTEDELRQWPRIVREREAEEVVLTIADNDGKEKDGQLTFQIDGEGKYVYLQYGNDEIGLLQSVGEIESPELYTSSGGSFSRGTGIPSSKLDEIALEFVRGGSGQPQSINWRPD